MTTRQDPRTFAAPTALTGNPQDIRPVVAHASTGLPLWILIGGMMLAGVLLFGVLDARRRAASLPTTKARHADLAGLPTAIAPLLVPPLPRTDSARVALAPIPPQPTPQPTPAPQVVYVPQPMPVQMPSPPERQERPAITASGPALVFDRGIGTAVVPNSEEGSAQPSPDANAEVAGTTRASVIRHRSTLVPQGTLIPAVLESALDSTRQGPARALVTRDVRGFDGSRILIPRGSRLFGEYRADVEPGQNRALVTWTRLIRPDGVAIALASPAGDPLGRVGIRGRVNSHFLERFASALLQSSLQIAVNRASQFGDSAVIVTNGGAAQTLTSPLTSGTQVRPTLSVRQGTTITVFVARDLDFTSVEARK